MQKLTIHITTLLIATLLIASCSTSRKASEGSTNAVTTFSAEKHIANVKAQRSDAKALTTKIKARLTMGNDDISTSGTLRMKRGEAIQISLVDPILGITEVAKVEFTKDKVQIIDRINRRYVEEPYSRAGFLSKANISFSTLEALFWNEVFQAGSPELDHKNFTVSPTADNTVDMVYADKYLTYRFTTDLLTGKLESTKITVPAATHYSLNMLYDDFKGFEGRDFPHSEKLQFVNDDGTTVELLIKMSAPVNDSDWSIGTKVSSKYKKMDAALILKSLFAK